MPTSICAIPAVCEPDIGCDECCNANATKQAKGKRPHRRRMLVERPNSLERCRTCRARGIKCDGRKPFCARCLKAERVCGGYTAWEVTLPGIHAQGPPQLETKSVIYNLPSSETEATARELVHSHGETWQYRRWYLRHVLMQMHHSRELAAATRAVIAKMRPQASESAGIKDYVESMRALRSSTMNNEQSLLTMFMLGFYEALGRNNEEAFAHHIGAQAVMLLAAPEKWTKSEAVRCVFQHIAWNLFGLAIKQNIASPFEKTAWLNADAAAAGAPDAQQLANTTHRAWIRLPRVIRILREIKSGTQDVAALLAQGFFLVEDLLSTAQDRDAESSLLQRSVLVETTNEFDRPWVPCSCELGNVLDFRALVSYCQTRLMMLNCYYELLRLGRDAGVTGSRIEPCAYSFERAQRVAMLLMSIQQNVRTGRAWWIVGCVCVWGALSSQDWQYRNQPPDVTRKWMIVKSRGASRWESFDAEKEMDGSADFFVGGAWNPDLTVCRTIPDIRLTRSDV